MANDAKAERTKVFFFIIYPLVTKDGSSEPSFSPTYDLKYTIILELLILESEGILAERSVVSGFETVYHPIHAAIGRTTHNTKRSAN